MTTRSPGRKQATALHQPQPAVITSARGAASTELSGRVRRYTLAMAFRMACFLAMIVVDGWLRWVLLAVAVFMPYLAVVLANQSDQRSGAALAVVTPGSATAITSGSADEVVTGDVLTGDVLIGESGDDDADPVRRAA